MPERLSWQESWRFLELRGGLLPATWDDGPAEWDNPKPDNQYRGPCLRDALHEEVDFENLTLPRTLFIGCRFHGVSFRNSDLNQSCLCGEFIDCHFSDA